MRTSLISLSMEDKNMTQGKHIDKHPSKIDRCLKTDTEIVLDTSELIVLNRISIALCYNRNLDKDIAESLPLIRVPIHMELFHEHSQGKTREPHTRLVLYCPPLKEQKDGTVKLSLDENAKLIGEGSIMTLDVPQRYGEIVNGYDCHSIVKAGEESLSKFVDREVNKHIEEYRYPSEYNKSAYRKDHEKDHETKISALQPIRMINGKVRKAKNE